MGNPSTAFIAAPLTTIPRFRAEAKSTFLGASNPRVHPPRQPARAPRQARRRQPIRFTSVPSAADGSGLPAENKPASQPTPVPSPAPSAALPRKFFVSRLAIFAAISLTYSTYVLLRSTFTYVAPMMAQSLSLPLPAIGKISSAFPLAYGMSRLFTGLLVDRSTPHVALCFGLLVAGLLNASMALTASVPILALLWALNGLFQGAGAGATVKIITAWFPPARRGFYWALWSTSANIGAFLAPMVCAGLASKVGFRAGLVVPGLFAAIFALVQLPLLRSSPSDAGFLAPWESPPPEKSTNSALSADDIENKKQSWWSVFVQGVLGNRSIWLLAFSYFFVYFIRSGTKSWLHFWLVQSRNIAAADAAYRVSGMEMGGIAGTFSAGIVSDLTGGHRVLVTIAYLVGVVASLAIVWFMPAGSAMANFAAFSVFGFMINGPQMMIGLIGAELCDKRVVATATGMLGWISYLGAAVSGYPLSVLVGRLGWSSFFLCLLASSVGAILCLVPLWRVRASAA